MILLLGYGPFEQGNHLFADGYTCLLRPSPVLSISINSIFSCLPEQLVKGSASQDFLRGHSLRSPKADLGQDPVGEYQCVSFSSLQSLGSCGTPDFLGSHVIDSLNRR